MTERSELDRTRDIFAHIREILERDGDKAEIKFNAIQLRMLLACEPSRYLPTVFVVGGKSMTVEEYLEWEKRGAIVPPCPGSRSKLGRAND